ncbi:pectinesterase [Colletotrichum truncatum]|uniref:Pectinesterase n=1 Tax=Colletotrichum truncatum TaxID=5467 RepID=A0ACC3ZF28_COLTU|nr:pectinesterase [Colletotrichum truncatum]KAF6801620.1 pectinesterase [Colletotrichum truncatum]
MKSLFTTFTFVTAALAASRTSAPSRDCLVVKKVPGSGQFGTIQQAVDALSVNATGSQCIFIDQGVYPEQVLVPKREAQLSIYGYTKDTKSYASNGVTITAGKSQKDGLNNDQTGTLRIKAKDFKLYNVNVANTFGQGSQAVALSAYSDSGFYGCQFTGFQDTLLSQKGNQLYSKSLIEGATDFIFGQYANAWFEQCDIRVVTAKIGYITAHGRPNATVQSEYVLNDCNIAAASNSSVPDGTYYLGRPWGKFAQVVFQKSNMSSVINSAGWTIWNKGDNRTDNVLFGEYKNIGMGSLGSRAGFSKQLDSAVAVKDVLGNNYKKAGYYDGSYM